MSMFSVFDISGSAMSAQSQRMNVTASNLANADSVAAPDGEAYRAKQVMFESQAASRHGVGGVGVREVVEERRRRRRAVATPRKERALDRPDRRAAHATVARVVPGLVLTVRVGVRRSRAASASARSGPAPEKNRGARGGCQHDPVLRHLPG